MRSLVLLSVCLTMASANLLNQYILDMATQNMDPLTRRIMRSSLGSMLDMDMGGGGNGGSGYGGSGYGSFGGPGFGNSFAMNPLYDPPQFGQSSSSTLNPLYDPPQFGQSVPSSNMNPVNDPLQFGQSMPSPNMNPYFDTQNLPSSNMVGAPSISAQSPAITTNVVDPSSTSSTSTKGDNPYMGTSGSASTLISPSAVPIGSPANSINPGTPMGMARAPVPPPYSFFQRYMMFRAMEAMMDFF